jgi:hypothetical protein
MTSSIAVCSAPPQTAHLRYFGVSKRDRKETQKLIPVDDGETSHAVLEMPPRYHNVQVEVTKVLESVDKTPRRIHTQTRVLVVGDTTL